MQQLRSIDIWATDIIESDLKLLTQLPNLEYLSIGGYDGQTTFTFNGVQPILKEMTTLKRICLDGITLNEKEEKMIDECYEYIRF